MRDDYSKLPLSGIRLQSTHASVYAGDFAANESVQNAKSHFSVPQ